MLLYFTKKIKGHIFKIITRNPKSKLSVCNVYASQKKTLEDPDANAQVLSKC